MKYRVGSDEAYLSKCRNREFYVIPSEELLKVYVRVPGEWNKYEPCRALNVQTSSIFSYVSGSFHRSLTTRRFGRRSTILQLPIILLWF